jgi:hypothetical protein
VQDGSSGRRHRVRERNARQEQQTFFFTFFLPIKTGSRSTQTCTQTCRRRRPNRSQRSHEAPPKGRGQPILAGGNLFPAAAAGERCGDLEEARQGARRATDGRSTGASPRRDPIRSLAGSGQEAARRSDRGGSRPDGAGRGRTGIKARQERSCACVRDRRKGARQQMSRGGEKAADEAGETAGDEADQSATGPNGRTP